MHCAHVWSALWMVDVDLRMYGMHAWGYNAMRVNSVVVYAAHTVFGWKTMQRCCSFCFWGIDVEAPVAHCRVVKANIHWQRGCLWAIDVERSCWTLSDGKHNENNHSRIVNVDVSSRLELFFSLQNKRTLVFSLVLAFYDSLLFLFSSDTAMSKLISLDVWRWKACGVFLPLLSGCQVHDARCCRMRTTCHNPEQTLNTIFFFSHVTVLPSQWRLVNLLPNGHWPTD